MGIVRNKILIITIGTTYFGPKFVGSVNNHSSSELSIGDIVNYLKLDFDVDVVSYADVDLRKNYDDTYVIYASTENRGLFYKHYIEGVLLSLIKRGAVLVPGFECCVAHGNKAFQEMLRYTFLDERLRYPQSSIIGRYDDIDYDLFTDYPYVVKASSGSGSKGVLLANNRTELRNIVKKLSSVTYRDYHFTLWRDLGHIKAFWVVKRFIYSLSGKQLPKKAPDISLNSNAVIVQDYIEGLTSDYKVLFYWGKYYVLKRMNRDNDFRASGSGKFIFPEKLEELLPILEFAEIAAQELDAPMMSLDIAKNDKQVYLIEYQFLGFGPYTFQYASWHFEKTGKVWVKVEGKDNIEKETARSYKEYIFDHIINRN